MLLEYVKTRYSIGDLCYEDKRIINPLIESFDSLKYIGLENIEGTTGKIIETQTSDVRSSCYYFSKNHILYSKLRPYLNKVAVPDFDGKCTMELVPLLPRTGVSRRYLALLLRKPQIVDLAMKEKTGARMPRVNIEKIIKHMPFRG